MKDESKTKKQLINELVELRQRIIELEKQSTKHKHVEESLQESEEKYRELVENLNDTVYSVDETGVFTYISPNIEPIMGYKQSEVIGHSFVEFLYHEDKQRILNKFQNVLSGHIEPAEYRIVIKSGGIRWVRTSSRPVYKEGRVTGLRGVLIDITERKRAYEAIRESEDRFHSLVDSTEDSIYLVDRNYKYLFINKKHLSRLGLSGDEYVGQEFGKFHSPDDTKWFVEKASKVFSTGESIIHEHKSFSDGRYFLLTLSPVKKSDGTITSVAVISKDITELKNMEEKLKVLVLRDELTGLYNRRGFFALLEQLLKLSKRQKTGMLMLYADVDNLKEINDTWGHQEGDLALIDTANILNENYRESDIIARIGGDEFVVIPVGTTMYNIEGITARLQKSIQVHNAKGNRNYTLSLSAGIVYYDPEHPCSIDELLVQGDKSMYEQKRSKYKF